MKLGFNHEPAVWLAAIRQVVLLSILFGLSINEMQVAGIMLTVEAVSALFNRQMVTANKNLV